VCVGPDDWPGVVDVFLPIFFFLLLFYLLVSCSHIIFYFFLVKMLVWSSKIVVFALHFGGIYDKCFLLIGCQAREENHQLVNSRQRTIMRAPEKCGTCWRMRISHECRRARAREQLKYLCTKISVFLENTPSVSKYKMF
jgi:hypothetical protein